MKGTVSTLGRRGAAFCWSCLVSFLCWTLWLLLGALLVLQMIVLTSHELAVPGFLLHSFEERLAASGVRATFGRTTFDPTGKVLIENLRLSLRNFPEPVVTARAAFVELDPWSLAIGHFEPRRVEGSDLRLYLPAMLSSSGRTEEMLSHFEVTLAPGEHEVEIEECSGTVAGVAVHVHGAIHFGAFPKRNGVEPLPFTASLAQNFPAWCRKYQQVAAQLAGVTGARAQIDLAPSLTRGAIATIALHADKVEMQAPRHVVAGNLQVNTRVPLVGDAPIMTPVSFSVDALEVDGGIKLRYVAGHARGALQIGSPKPFDPRALDVSAVDVSAAGFSFDSVVTHVDADPLPKLRASLATHFQGELVGTHGRLDLAQRSADLQVRGRISPQLLDTLGAVFKRDLRHFVDFHSPIDLEAKVAFADGWKFQKLTGHVATTHIDAYHVPFDLGRGDIELDRRHFIARHAIVTHADNYAQGTFEQDFATKRFRFLLNGKLRPLILSPWFHEWWSSFFGDFVFAPAPSAPPAASVDVQGIWGIGRDTSVFVQANSTAPQIRGVKFDHARTLIFVRPTFYDALELEGTQGAGALSGTFTREVDFDLGTAPSFDFNLNSTLPLGELGQLFGHEGATRLAPFRFENAPAVKFSGHVDGLGSKVGSHFRWHLELESTGNFSLYDFPLHNLSFVATEQDDDLSIERVRAGFADGQVTGKTRLTGSGPDRMLGFDCILREASLGEAITTVQQYLARRRGQPPPPSGKFLRGKANVKVDIAASAQGRFEDPFSFKGEGNAMLSGPGLGEVRLLGALSELLNFTSLRFNAARANFALDGPKLTFTDVKITGANSAIEGRGTYLLDHPQLDFRARVRPFQESEFLLKSLMGAVLTPLSAALEVKLSGTPENPSWAFVIGPTNFFRNLAQPSPTAAPPPSNVNSPLIRR